MDPLEIMKSYKKWAVVGVTEDESRYGYLIYKKLKGLGYQVYPINPKLQEVDGDKVYASLKDLPEIPEVVNFVVNPAIGISVVKTCAELGIDKIWLQPGTISQPLLDLAEENHIEAIQACVLVVGGYL